MEISESFRNRLGKLGGRFALFLTHVIHVRPDLWVWGALGTIWGLRSLGLDNKGPTYTRAYKLVEVRLT
jgi:hypothetical protein